MVSCSAATGGFVLGYPQGIWAAHIYFYLIFEIKMVVLSRNLWKNSLICGLSHFLSVILLIAPRGFI